MSAEQARAVGIGVRLTKPVQLSRVAWGVCRTWTRSGRVRVGCLVPVPVVAPGGSRGHVLVVEDNHVNQLVAVGILEYLGYSTEVAGNGIEALAALARTPVAAVPMDCQMPEMDGYEATVELRRLEGTGAHTPGDRDDRRGSRTGSGNAAWPAGMEGTSRQPDRARHRPRTLAPHRYHLTGTAQLREEVADGQRHGRSGQASPARSVR